MDTEVKTDALISESQPTTALMQIKRATVPTLAEVQSLQAICQLAAMSGFLSSTATDPQRRMADAFFVAMYGLELGIAPMTALRQIYVIDGKPSCSAQLLLGLARKAGIKVEMPNPSDVTTSATVYITRPGGERRAYTYTEDMAQKAGLLSKAGVWQKYKREMMIWRAVSTGLRMEASDVLGGLYTIEEMSPDTPLNEDGEPIGDIVYQSSKPAALPPNATPFSGTDASLPWYTVENNKNYFLGAMVKGGVGKTKAEALTEVLRLTSHATWEDFGKAYETGKLATDAVQAALAAENANLPPASPKADAPAPPAATPAPFVWNDDSITDLSAWTQRHIGMTAAETKLKLMHTEWTIHPTMAAAQKAIQIKVKDTQTPVYANEVSFRPLNKGVETVFKTLVGDITMPGGRTEIKKLLKGDADGYAALVGMDKWEKGKGTYSLEQNPLKVVWELKEGRQQLVALSLKHPLPEPEGLDDVPFIPADLPDSELAELAKTKF